MQILYLVPGSLGPGFDQDEVDRRQHILQRIAGDKTTVVAKASGAGPLSIESMYDEYSAIPGTIDAIIQAEKDGFDGVIVGCAGDPGVDGAREAVSIPVIGPAQASFAMASILGRHFSVITPLDETIGTTEDLIAKCGFKEHLASIRSAGITVLKINENPEFAKERALEESLLAKEEDRADCIVLGCMSLAFAQFDRVIEKTVGIPIVNPAFASLKLLESLISLKLSHSKVAYPTPTNMLR